MGRAVHHGPRKVTSSETWLVKFNRLKGFEVPLLHFFFFTGGMGVDTPPTVGCLEWVYFFNLWVYHVGSFMGIPP